MPYRDSQQQRAYQREWMRKRRAEFFDGKCCVRCGSTDRLELDHIEPAEKVSHQVWSWKAERRDAELAKCQVLCHDCHHQKTVRELPFLSIYEAEARANVTNSHTCPSVGPNPSGADNA